MAPNSVPNPAQVPALEGPTHAFEDRRGRGLAIPGVLARQVLVRRHHLRVGIVPPVVQLVQRLGRLRPEYLAPVRHVHRRRRRHVVVAASPRRPHAVVPSELVHDPGRRRLPGLLEGQGQPPNVAFVIPLDSAAAPDRRHVPVPVVVALSRGAWAPVTVRISGCCLVFSVGPDAAVVDRGPEIFLAELRRVRAGRPLAETVAVAAQQPLAAARRQFPALRHINIIPGGRLRRYPPGEKAEGLLPKGIHTEA